MCSGVPASRKKHLEAKGAGHYGIFSGRRWRDVVYPVVKAFIAEHNPQPQQQQLAAPAKKAAARKPAAKAVAVKVAPAKATPVKAVAVKSAPAKAVTAKASPAKKAARKK
jgi:poly(3-hydroxybutyrate) depolymerase